MDQQVRPIDANALYDMIHDNACQDVVGIADVLDFIEIAPTLDYEPVKRGDWKYYHKKNKAVCLACSFERDLDADFGRAVSCPNCGARMGGKESK